MGYDAVMVELHPLDASHVEIVDRAATDGVGVLVKKPLASGRIGPAHALPFALALPAVAACVVGSLSALHLAECLEIARRSIERPATNDEHSAKRAPR
jgi:hypothetical protein